MTDLSLHPDLLAAKSLIYGPHELACTTPMREPESAAYGAYALSINGLATRFRVAKTTPTKVGQFVTLWQRGEAGPIRPFDTSDNVKLFVISVRDHEQFGQFVFPVDTLVRRGVVSRDGVGGKRAIRVYPPWVAPTSRQARNTQTWQLEYFLPPHQIDECDCARARTLFAKQLAP
ncbi:MepB family protein [Rhodococcus marinonascens]|uniref:MepB family protein n=1 Tax=Rhodococcus marinonascens TaxID=38311 RepID=UPI000AF1077C|nr:MepB family protein [Rhodococcus marinonascens]